MTKTITGEEIYFKIEKARLKEDQKALTDLLLKENDYKIKTD